MLQRFYGLPHSTMRHFYAGRLTPADKARLLVGRPPVPMGEAVRVLLNRPVPKR
jgi:lycopene beta-cyclase